MTTNKPEDTYALWGVTQTLERFQRRLGLIRLIR
jgi:hypothetical protein